MNLDHELKQALRRVPAPEGFADRVLAHAKNGERPAAAAPRWRAVAATLLVAAVLGGWSANQVLERRREHDEGERAREQVLVALRITGAKVAQAQRGVSRHMTR